ncbi:MAG: DUF401 family protein [Bacillota bacterium]
MREIIGVIVAFALILWLVGRKVQLGLVMLYSSTVLGLFAGGFEDPHRLLVTDYKALTDRDTIEFVVVIALITALARLMGDLSFLEAMSNALARLLRSTKLALVTVPGVIGCLPVFGGAVISAPMVDSLGDRLDLDPDRKAAINIIFRHTWFFVFPFIPSLMLAARIAELDVSQLIRLQWPMTAAGIIAGYLYFFGRMPRESADGAVFRFWPDLRDFLVNGAPLLIAVILGVGLPVPFIGVVKPPLYVGLATGIAVGMVLGRRHPNFRWDLPIRGVQWTMVWAMLGVMLFRWTVNEVTFFPVLIDNLIRAGVPLAVLCVALPMAIGMASASQATTIALTYPILLSIVPAGSSRALYAMLIYVSSYMAYMVSPLHLCQVFTVQYFGATLSKVYRYYVVPMSAILVSMVAVYFIAR